LLVGVKSWANVRALRAVLSLFAVMSGLKVNFHKSLLVGVNIADSWLNEVVSILDCKVGKVLFMYLGLSIGGDPRRLAFWDPVLNTIKSRLTRWHNRFLSFGGRLVLLKFALTSLHVYALSFFKALSGIISSIESIFNYFFGGGSEDNRKISWIAWSSISLRKEDGGLGVRKLNEFNIALLEKWCWQLLVDRGGLWYRVLVARYGEEAGRLEVGGRSVSTWWRELAKIRDEVGSDGGSWFADRVASKVGTRTNTLFWQDRWLGDVPLCRRFSHLFDLSLNKSSTVAEMFSLGWEEGGEVWGCRRRLWDWEEEMLGECRHLLDNFVLQTDVFDKWQWLPDIAGGYIVRGAYQILTTQAHHIGDDIGDIVWHKQVPLKVSILAWRLLQDRLSTKTNLLNRDIIQPTTKYCVTECGNDETTLHMFFHCNIFGALWQHIRNWLGVYGAEPYNAHDHFFQFTNVLGTSRTQIFHATFLAIGSVDFME